MKPVAFLEGGDFLRHPKRFEDKLVKRIRGIVKRHGERVEREIKASMREPKSGRVYVREGGRLHRASAPGEAPAVDTGNLYKSIQTQIRDGGMTAETGTDVPYAKKLHEGKEIAQRPILTFGMGDPFSEDVAEAVNKSL